VTGIALDEANVRKMLNRFLEAADLSQRGPRQSRHTYASLLLQEGAPITYVSRQLGHKDAAITLRVYAHWLPDSSKDKLVNLLDDVHHAASQAHPTSSDTDQRIAASAFSRMVSRGGIEPPTRRLRVCCSAN
jgi:site-specific recombinase XerC